MIHKQEIMTMAAKYGLSANSIEKDYVLSWLLAGIFNTEELNQKWIFKGGTCLKKCYFDEYRFSEDLDFTITDDTHINVNFLLAKFAKISDWIYEETGISIPTDEIRFEQYENPRGKMSIEGRLSYKGPMQRKGSNATVKLDLTNDEILVYPPDERSILHHYSDVAVCNKNLIYTYCIEEIMAEKLRALVERMRPRDLFDIVNIHFDTRWNLDPKVVYEILVKKCAFKQVALPTLSLINSMDSKKDLITDWSAMLAHQIANLKPHSYYWDRLKIVFGWLYDGTTA